MRRALVLAAGVSLLASTALAQTKAPIGRVVADVRGASTGLPSAEGWTPVVPTGTIVPSRGLGVELGGHVYVLRFGSGALGVGATWLTGRGLAAPPEVPPGGTSPSPPGTIPEVETRLRTFAPQVSLNFGHSLGWSYLSAGLGRARVESEPRLARSSPTLVPVDSGWVKSLNFGGGARWFLTDHVGIGFDVRWHKLSLVAPTTTRPGAPRATLIVAGAGLVLQ